MTEFTTIGDLLSSAEQHLTPVLLDYIRAGAGAEHTLRRNRSALEHLALEQRLLVQAGEVDLHTTFCGIELECPMATSPMGAVSKAHPDGDIEMARGAVSAGAIATVANGLKSSYRAIAEAAGGPLLAQLRCTGNPDEHADKLAEIRACPQYKGIVVTVDGSVEARLDRFIANNAAAETGWTLRVPGARFTWSDLDRLRSQTSLPMGFKGIMHGEDARAALDHGADFVWVSNHGARKFDSTRASVDVLDDVVDAVGERVPIVIDSGFQRGSEVATALAKGATLVSFGKLSVQALGLDGAMGVSRMFQILQEELHNALACTGSTRLSELNPAMVRSVPA